LAVARRAQVLDPGAERAYWSELGRLTALARAAIHSRGASANPSLNTQLSFLIFERLGFVREVEDTDLRFVLLPNVLRERRGSCVGLGTLYLALTEALEIPAHGVLRPGHFYVRLEQSDQHTNVELLRRGELMPDSWYEGRFPVPGGAAREYGRPLLPDETLGVVEFNVGNQRRRQQRIEDARQAYARAVEHFPDFAEAHASLGTALHLLGRLDEAAASYRTAKRVNPHLPRVEDNLSLLELERSR
jgi:regulator of sirC expression with transglutaminase-like and TPR domain